jgi:hypothetical protein
VWVNPLAVDQNVAKGVAGEWVERFEERAKAFSHAYLGARLFRPDRAPQLSEDLWDEDLSRPLADLELLRDLPGAHPVCHETQKLVRFAREIWPIRNIAIHRLEPIVPMNV